MKPIRVLLADDCELIRAGIRSLLKELDQIEVVGEAENGKQALELVEALRPDVALIDIVMPELNGFDVTATIVNKFPSVRVIILSTHASEEHVLQAVRAGASGYLPKSIGPTELEQAIRKVNEGEMYFSQRVAKFLVTGLRGDGKISSLERLTSRQRQVLQLVAEGNSSKVIAKKLCICPKTAEAHRGELMNALDIHDTASLVRYAIRVGLVTSDA